MDIFPWETDTNKDVKRIHLTPLLDAVEGIKNVEDRSVNECISQGISVYFAIPPKMVAQTIGMPSGVVADLDDDELYEDGSRILIDYAHVDSLVTDYRLKFVRLAMSDLGPLRDKGEVTAGEFTNGGLMSAKISSFELLPGESRGYELQDYGRCRLLRYKKDRDPFGESDSAVKLLIKLVDLLVDREDVPRIRGEILAALAVEDRWGHRDEAPVVHLIYRAAQHFSDKEYSAALASEWLKENDLKGFFDRKDKALDYAANLINRNPRKKSIERGDTLDLNKITSNKVGKNYTEEKVASNRLSLLHLATDYWIHDNKHLEEKSFLPEGGLWDFLRSVGFKTTEDTNLTGDDGKKKVNSNRLECQVAFLESIIKGDF